jgi:hypothetical protein
MVRILPVPPPPPDVEAMTAEQWEQARPGLGDGPKVDDGNEVTMYRTGPGDQGFADQWLGINIGNAPHEGVENGRGLFTLIPGPPPETHKGYDFPDDNAIIDRSTTRQALFWSDWASSTALQAGGRGSFTGEHVVIARVPPGSTQGYMPTDPGMMQANNDRNSPEPWDAAIVLGTPPTM